MGTVVILMCFVFLFPILLTADASSEVQSHKHRLHHGGDHARLRSRRYGREGTIPPLMQSYVSDKVTDAYAAYKVDEPVPYASQQNLHKPDFKECANYRPAIDEAQPIGTSVITVKAYDLDPLESGGTVTYSIVSRDETSDSFVVDNATGLVTTKKMFDRDEPIREKELYVTVRATDNGRPQLDAVCTMKVKVLDVNDNHPTWEKHEYKESIPQDLAIGQVVMRISATDIDDGNNGTVIYRLERHPSSPADFDFFDVVPGNGEVRLKQQIDEGRSQFYLRAIASDKGTPPQTSDTNLSITVVEPYKKPPTFEDNHPTMITLPEKKVDQTQPILNLTAKSNAEDQLVFFELVNGQTQPTNKEAIFTLETVGNVAYLKLDRDLDYEAVSQYTLTIRAWNKYNLATETQITIMVEDENDEKPYFTDVVSGSVLENEPVGTSVMRVRAIDIDGTSPNNEVTYYLKQDDQENFRIDQYTGEITTLKQFDREQQDVYQVTVLARDGAPSALPGVKESNERPQTLKIEIADINDNPPHFARRLYLAEVSEDANQNSKVIEIKADDKDTASFLTYSIIEGNEGNAFSIESTSTSGVVLIQNVLDYETIREYNLTIRASDSLYNDDTKIRITVNNINDNNPVFENMTKTTTIVEESIPIDCIFRVKAYDPDIGDRTKPQNISYFMVDKQGVEHFSVDKEGCVRVIKPLDRDQPNGFPSWQIFVGAHDEWGLTTTKHTEFVELTVILTDINDNEPFLDSTNPVVWRENQPRGNIIQLTANDYDSPANGPPFKFSIAPSADPELLQLFGVQGKTFIAKKDNFDREYRKQYLVPIQITDSGTPEKTGISWLTVIIGDENDNEMKPGESKIFVYKYKQSQPFTIGRVYVDDPDDWDLPDKTFTLQSQGTFFTVDGDTGDINMLATAPATTHELVFKVADSKWGNEVTAKVNVTVRQITDEAIDNSGSIRFMGITKEQFIEPDNKGVSKKDLLQANIAKICDVPVENVDIFTVNNSPQNPDLFKVDVRYSVHNSPYWPAEKLDGLIGQEKEMLEKEVKLNIMMIRIDECISERLHCPETSCTNILRKMDIAYKIFTNTSSFVGVNAFIDYECTCDASLLPKSSCIPNPCLNKGICRSGGGLTEIRCECTEEYEGPYCEKTSVFFRGNEWAWYPPLSVCEDADLQLQFRTGSKNGLILYNGPIYQSPMNVTDFVSLELRDGRPELRIDYGTGVSILHIPNSPNLGDDKFHLISLTWTPKNFTMRVDDCIRRDSSCYVTRSPRGGNSFLNVNGPLQLGGLSFNPDNLLSFMDWSKTELIPSRHNFTGCIANLTFKGKFYNLGEPSFFRGNLTDCDSPSLDGIVIKVGVDINFIIIVLVCILVLLLLVIAIVFYKRRRSYEEVKGDLGDDVRENIINYSDEGGGEGDQTGYDLSVLMKATNGPSYITSPPDKIPMEDLRPIGRVPDTSEGPDIQSFLQGNKNKVDNDPDGLPYDDVRNYAYEGDGNSMGSLSSLASGTDDGDLNFDYLPTFGPRFKKLADMYGGQSSDDESYAGPTPEAWC